LIFEIVGIEGSGFPQEWQQKKKRTEKITVQAIESEVQ